LSVPGAKECRLDIIAALVHVVAIYCRFLTSRYRAIRRINVSQAEERYEKLKMRKKLTVAGAATRQK
jgi:hypothetical protein